MTACHMARVWLISLNLLKVTPLMILVLMFMANKSVQATAGVACRLIRCVKSAVPDLCVGAQSGTLGRSSAHHRPRLGFRELALALLPTSPTDFGEVCFHGIHAAWYLRIASAVHGPEAHGLLSSLIHHCGVIR